MKCQLNPSITIEVRKTTHNTTPKLLSENDDTSASDPGFEMYGMGFGGDEMNSDGTPERGVLQ